MTTKAKASPGTLISIQDSASPTNYIHIGMVKTMTGPDKSLATIDVTNFDSPNNYSEFIAGFKDGGSVNMEVLFDPTDLGQLEVDEAYEARELRGYKIAFPQFSPTVTFAFDALCVKIGRPSSAQTTGALLGTIELKVSGALTES